MIRPQGVGVAEAPRGTLFHHYWVDEVGRIEKVNLIIATGQNNNAMNRGVLEVAKQYVKGDKIQEGMLNRVEAAIRCYDPCLSCSTHAVGKMPMVVSVVDPQRPLCWTRSSGRTSRPDTADRSARGRMCHADRRTSTWL